MPIRRELRHFYGREWREVTRPRILDRAHRACELCLVPNHLEVERCFGWWFDPVTESWIHAGNKQPVYVPAAIFPGTARRTVYIILTVAHLNHTPGEDNDDNLKALCQWCHLHYDETHHRETRAIRKDASRPLLKPIVDPLDSRMRCLHCNREQEVSLRACLAHGWPTCCDQTMLLVSTPGPETIDAAVAEMCSGARAVKQTLMQEAS
jgi:transcription elongation factor Elf1